MARGKPLTVTLYYGGVQVDTLNEEQRARIGERLSRAMSTYYTAHPVEYRDLVTAQEQENERTQYELPRSETAARGPQTASGSPTG